MSESIKDSKEFLVAFNELAIFLIERLRDGVQFDDFIALYNKLTADPEFSSILQKAYDNMSNIQLEFKDLDVKEMVELISIQLEYAPRIISMIKNT